MFVTPLALNVLIPILKDVFKTQAATLFPGQKTAPLVRKNLEKIDITRVFDMHGLQEVLGELRSSAAQQPRTPQNTTGDSGLQTSKTSPVTPDIEKHEASSQTHKERMGMPCMDLRTPKNASASEETPQKCFSTLPSLRPNSTPRTPPLPLATTKRMNKDIIMDSEDEGEFTPLPTLPSLLSGSKRDSFIERGSSDSLSPPPSPSPAAPPWFQISPDTKRRAQDPIVLNLPPDHNPSQQVSTWNPPRQDAPIIQGEMPRPLSTAINSALSIQSISTGLKPENQNIYVESKLGHNTTKVSPSPALTVKTTVVPKSAQPELLVEACPSEQQPSPRKSLSLLYPSLPESFAKPPNPAESSRLPPSFLLITHVQALLSSHFLFHSSDRARAHRRLDELSVLLHKLAREAAIPVMLLNGMTSPFQARRDAASSYLHAVPALYQPVTAVMSSPGNQKYDLRREPAVVAAHTLDHDSDSHYDSSLISIFSIPSGRCSTTMGITKKDRRRPAYGSIFARLVDVHMLCTRVPRMIDDIRTVLVASGTSHANAQVAWVVEVLTDEVGVVVDEGGQERGSKYINRRRVKYRDQKWGALDVAGRRIIDIRL